jgi:hypothetical protein
LRQALAKAQSTGAIKRSAEADRLWEVVYPELAAARAGAFGKATERARPQVMRLALLYALLEGNPVIAVEHLRAALAVWRYCEASAGVIFGRQQEQEPLAFQLLSLIEQGPGITRNGLHEATGKKHSAEDRADALAWLQAQRLVHAKLEPLPQGGPPCERWFPGPVSPSCICPEPRPAADPPKEDREPRPAVREAEAPPQAGAEPGAGCGQRPAAGSPLDVEPVPSADRGSLTADGSEPLSLPDLLARVKEVGGRFVRTGEEVSVDAVNVTPDIDASLRAHQSDLRLLIPEPAPTPKRYPDAESTWEAIIYQACGDIVKDAQGHCTLHLPTPDPELEAAWEEFRDEIGADRMAQAEFVRQLRCTKVE